MTEVGAQSFVVCPPGPPNLKWNGSLGRTVFLTATRTINMDRSRRTHNRKEAAYYLDFGMGVLQEAKSGPILQECQEFQTTNAFVMGASEKHEVCR